MMAEGSTRPAAQACGQWVWRADQGKYVWNNAGC